MLFETNKDKGRAGMALGIAWFGANGYTVNVPLNDTQWYDFIVEKDGVFQTVQCKATGSKDGRIDFRCTGGTDGGMYDHALQHPVDWLFCLNQDGKMFVIPVEDMRNAGVGNGITLRTEAPSALATRIKFDTSKYLVTL